MDTSYLKFKPINDERRTIWVGEEGGFDRTKREGGSFGTRRTGTSSAMVYHPLGGASLSQQDSIRVMEERWKDYWVTTESPEQHPNNKKTHTQPSLVCATYCTLLVHKLRAAIYNLNIYCRWMSQVWETLQKFGIQYEWEVLLLKINISPKGLSWLAGWLFTLMSLHQSLLQYKKFNK